MVLLGLIGCGIILPLIAVSWHMLSSTKFSGPNGIMQETLAFYYHSKFSVKESQVKKKLGRGPRQESQGGAGERGAAGAGGKKSKGGAGSNSVRGKEGREAGM